jgi:alkylhydroperoxidase family enzyme
MIRYCQWRGNPVYKFSRNATLFTQALHSVNLSSFHSSSSLTMRIPYVEDPPRVDSPEEQEIVDRIKARRGSRGLVPVDLTLLHAPILADGWNTYLGSVRSRTSLADDVREIVICRVAYLNEAWYEWKAHALIARKAGVSEEGMETIKGKGTGGLDEKQTAAMNYAGAMATGNRVPDEIFNKAKSYFDDKGIVELTLTIAQYICTAKFLSALNVAEMNDSGPPGEGA